MSKFSIVEIDGVASNVTRSNFDEVDLDTLADSILESGGILKPLVLRKIGFEKYEVIDGHFEYYAAVKAREKNPHRGEIVNAFIIPAEKEDAILNQVAFLKSVNSPETIVNPPKAKQTQEKIDSNQTNNISELLSQNLKPIYTMLNQLISHPSTNTQAINPEDRINSLENKIEYLTSVVEKLVTDVEKLIPRPQPPKLNLLTATNEEIMIGLSQVGASANYIKSALQAIEYWRQPGKSLTWENLYKSTKSGENKIKNFANATYQKLKEIAEIRTQ